MLLHCDAFGPGTGSVPGDRHALTASDSGPAHRAPPSTAATVTGTSKQAETAAEVSTAPGRAGRRRPPAAQQGDVGRPGGYLLDVVGHEHERGGVGRGGQGGEARHQPFPGPEVEAGGRLVEEEELGRRP